MSNQFTKVTFKLHTIDKDIMLDEWEVHLYMIIPPL